MEDNMSGLMSIEEAAEYLGLKVATIYKYTSSRRLPFVKIGSRVLFTREKLEEFVKNHIVEPVTNTAEYKKIIQ
jgi:excisionase family DNA binding protein